MAGQACFYFLEEGIDALSFSIKLQDGRVIRRRQGHMRARLCSSEPMSPTLVNYLGPEQIESRLPPELDTAPQVPVHTPDTLMPENPPVQKSIVAMSTHHDDPFEKSGHLNVSVLDKVWI